ncbi:MAG: hypothetical protein HQK87_00830 [Nitrospinae bacterium]|nr:hypothetical protein [Nitrospinota bacterium]
MATPQAVISLHMPKAGGTSMLEMLRRAYGPETLLLDEDDPAIPTAECNLNPDRWLAQRPTRLPEGIHVVHGHFRASKYDLIESAFRFTFLRHPVDNVRSIYRYWKRIPPHPSPLHQYFLEKDLDLVGFARLPTIRFLYSRTYFGGWNTDTLDFVGRHEHRAADIGRLEALLNVTLDTNVWLNATGSKDTRESGDDRAVASGWDSLTELLAEDITLYERLTHRHAL